MTKPFLPSRGGVQLDSDWESHRRDHCDNCRAYDSDMPHPDCLEGAILFKRWLERQQPQPTARVGPELPDLLDGTPTTNYRTTKLLETAAQYLERRADTANPGSRDYLEHLDIARQCADAADDIREVADDIRDGLWVLDDEIEVTP